jgi:hypothetical protein
MNDLRTVSLPISRAIALMAGVGLMWYGATLVTIGGIALMLLGLTMAVAALAVGATDTERLAPSPVLRHPVETRGASHRR